VSSKIVILRGKESALRVSRSLGRQWVARGSRGGMTPGGRRCGE
jgi:hypothetical protein